MNEETTADPGAARLRSDRIALLLIVVALIRIIISEPVFSATADEAMHVIAGLQILTDHKYGVQLQNPPLMRVMLAAGPWMAGAHIDRSRGIFEQLGDFFHSTGHYRRDLALARAGAILMLLIAMLASWRLARRELEPAATTLAVLLLTTQPVVLGYSMIANHDGPAIAGLALALLALSRWIEKPTPARAAWIGAAYAFSIALKFSDILYVPVACAAYLGVRMLQRRAQLRRVGASLVAAVLTSAVVLWATYGFTVGTIIGPENLFTLLGKSSRVTSLYDFVSKVHVPAPHFFSGVLELFTTNQHGHPAYAFGRRSMHGWWWYFPACVGLKTTIGSMLLVLAGCIYARRNRELVAMAVTALAILASSMSAHLDVGVRYVLPMYVPFSLAAGAAALALWRGGRAARVTVVVLLGWHLVASTIAHPDYFPYFNELAGREPSRYLIDSNLDWGQDVLRLRDVLRKEHVPHLYSAVAGVESLDKLGFPPVSMPPDQNNPSGWLAVSEHVYRMGLSDGVWRQLPPNYRRVGKSIRLYHLP